MKFKATPGLKTVLWLDRVNKKALMLYASPIDIVASVCDASWEDRQKQGMLEFLKLLFQPFAPTKTYDEDIASIILRLIVAEALGILPSFLEELLEPISRDARCCKELEDTETSFEGRN
ncbi:hypothetical protein F4801DRAFT_390651 [Xylaria longipes]|nr:hypothetical protein F4801DRAFT_390651 [Xylaria longipes]RYC63627.1 hypothetical protein CHU98_g2549 [Xylaria longipes]